MTHTEFLNEPADMVYLTLIIDSKIKRQKEREAKWQQPT